MPYISLRLLLCLALLALSMPFAASAQTAEASLVLTPNSGPCDIVNPAILVEGRNLPLPPGERIGILVIKVPGNVGVATARTTIGPDGGFAVEAQLAACAPDTPPGTQFAVHVLPNDGNAASIISAIYTVTEAPRQACFAETGFCITGRFLDYWEAHGGLAIYGYPISDQLGERLYDEPRFRTVQYFERARFEYHPENDPPYELLLGQFGRRFHPADPPVAEIPGALYFSETGHNVTRPEFAAYWEAHGGLAQFGYPLSEEFTETLENGQQYSVQYFERARFEWHPENGDPYKVLLGQFGRRVLAESGR